jgi:signal peptidase I
VIPSAFFHSGLLMTEIELTGFASPWATLWLSPRQTIERIVATRPSYLVLPLAALGTIAGLYTQVAGTGFEGMLTDWRLALGFLGLGAVLGIVWLYLGALVLSWIGMLLGGEATARQLRAVFAWSAVPAIPGAAVILALTLGLKAAGGGNTLVASGLSWLGIAIGLWTTVVFLLMLARVEQFGFWRTILAWFLNSFLLALLVAMAVRTLLYQPFSIPASSMIPTLLVGDNVFASKFAYGYSRFSLPFSPPLFSGRVLGAEPQRGDVVVFRLPKDERTDYVKRVVGLPGDRIQMKEGLLYINDVPVKREPLADFVGAACGTDTAAKVKRWRETLPNGVTYETLDCVPNGFYDNTSVYTVPAGSTFMLGDNRDNSTDSRVLSSVGYIPLENPIGRVDMIYFSLMPGSGEVRSERIGMVVR